MVDRSILAESWTRLEIRRRDAFYKPSYDSAGIVYLTEAARTRKKPLPMIVIDDPIALRLLRDAFPSEELEPSVWPTRSLSFECSVTTESGRTVLLYYSDYRVDIHEAHGKISVVVTGRDYHHEGTTMSTVVSGRDYCHEGSAADRFFETLWVVCKKDGLFDGSFSDFIITKDDMKRMFPERIQPRDVRLERELESLAKTTTTDTLGHAEGAEPKSHAKSVYKKDGK